MSERLLTEEEVRIKFEEWIGKDNCNYWVYGWLADFGAELEKVAETQDAKTLKAVGEWLDKCDGITVGKDEIVRLSLNDLSYRSFPTKAVEALKRGEFPE